MSEPITVTLPKHTSGDTWDGLTLGPFTFDGGAPPAALASCKLYFRRLQDDVIGWKFKSSPEVGWAYGTIVITDALTWTATVSGVLPLAPGQWTWNYQTTDANGAVRTLLEGVLTVKEDPTRE